MGNFTYNVVYVKRPLSGVELEYSFRGTSSRPPTPPDGSVVM